MAATSFSVPISDAAMSTLGSLGKLLLVVLATSRSTTESGVKSALISTARSAPLVLRSLVRPLHLPPVLPERVFASLHVALGGNQVPPQLFPVLRFIVGELGRRACCLLGSELLVDFELRRQSHDVVLDQIEQRLLRRCRILGVDKQRPSLSNTRQERLELEGPHVRREVFVRVCSADRMKGEACEVDQAHSVVPGNINRLTSEHAYASKPVVGLHGEFVPDPVGNRLPVADQGLAAEHARGQLPDQLRRIIGVVGRLLR